MAPRGEAQPIPMSPRLVQTLGRAAEYARAQSHVEVALEHVLLALSEDEDAGAILSATRVDVDGLKTDVSGHLGRIEARMPDGHPGTSAISVELREVLQAAAKAARQSRRGDIDGAIVLCAIVGHGQSNAAALLRLYGLTFEEAIRVLQERMRATAPPPSAPVTAPSAPPATGPSAAPQEPAAGGPQGAQAPAEPETTGRPRRDAEAILADARSRIESRKTSGVQEDAEPQPPAASADVGGDPVAEEPPVAAAQVSHAPAGGESMAPAAIDPDQPGRPVGGLPAPTPEPLAQPARPSGMDSIDSAVPRPPAPEPPAVLPPTPPAPTPQQPQPQPQPVAPPRSWTPPPGPPPGTAAEGTVPARPYRVPPPPPLPPDGGLAPPHVTEPRPVRAEPTQAPPPWAPPPGPGPVFAPRPAGGPPVGGPPFGGPMGGPGALPPLDDVLPPGVPPGYPETRDPRGPSQSARPGTAPGYAPPVAQAPAGPNLPAAPSPPTGRTSAPAGSLAREPSPRAETTGSPERGAGRARSRKRSTSAAVEDGQLVENIPRYMRVGIASVVEVRIAKAEVKALAEGLEGGGAAYHHDVLVTKAMSVRLRAPDGGFFIETASPETQWIDSALGLFADDFASWRWTVTPRERGRRRLQLVVSARTVGGDGLVAETALPDQIVEVRVRTNYARSLQMWAGWILAAVIGGVFARFGEDLLAVGLPLLMKLTNP